MKFFEHSIFVRGRTWRIPKVDAMLDAALASILDAGGYIPISRRERKWPEAC